MALIYPLSYADFADLLKIESVTFHHEWMQESSGNGKGEILTADIAPSRWKAEVTTVLLYHAEANKVMARIDALGGGKHKFYLSNPLAPYPQSDLSGASLIGETILVASVTDSYTLSLEDLPADFVVTTGDMLSIDYGTPTRTYLGRFVEDGTANGVGDLPSIQVAPALPAGVLAGDFVSLLKPHGKFKMVVNSAYPSVVTTLSQKITFTAFSTTEAG